MNKINYLIVFIIASHVLIANCGILGKYENIDHLTIGIDRAKASLKEEKYRQKCVTDDSLITFSENRLDDFRL